MIDPRLLQPEALDINRILPAMATIQPWQPRTLRLPAEDAIQSFHPGLRSLRNDEGLRDGLGHGADEKQSTASPTRTYEGQQSLAGYINPHGDRISSHLTQPGRKNGRRVPRTDIAGAFHQHGDQPCSHSVHQEREGLIKITPVYSSSVKSTETHPVAWHDTALHAAIAAAKIDLFVTLMDDEHNKPMATALNLAIAQRLVLANHQRQITKVARQVETADTQDAAEASLAELDRLMDKYCKFVSLSRCETLL